MRDSHEYSAIRKEARSDQGPAELMHDETFNLTASEEEVRKLTLSESDLEAAKRLLRALTGLDIASRAEESPEEAAERRLRSAATALARRRKRVQFFKRGLVGEPPFDLLLALYVEGTRRQAISITELAQLADLPPSTSTRWLQYLEDEGLVERKRDEMDKRVLRASLTHLGVAKLDDFFDKFDD